MSGKDRRVRAACLRTASVLVAALLSGAFATQASAQGANGDDEEGERARAPAAFFEITPFASYRMGGDFDIADSQRSANLNDHGSFGIALDLQADPDSLSQYELFYSRQESQLSSTSPLGPLSLNVEYLHLGGTLVLDDELRRLTPYLAGGLGVTRFNPDSQVADDDTRFSMSLGAGVRVPVTNHFGLRFEARGYVTLLNKDSAVFCASGSFGGFCSIRASGDTFVQYELLAGASFAF